MPQRPEYGIDAPPVIRNLVIAGVACLALGWFHPDFHLPHVSINAGPAFFWTGGFCLVEAALMVVYSLHGKFKHRDRMLELVNWRGDERVLDVGTGRGLMLIGAAKKLSSGHAVGTDIWSRADLSGNSLERTQKNAELEGVSDRVELRSDDARKLSFPEASFDVVLSNLCLHNIPSSEGRAQACWEIARVLKPRGAAVISDYKNTAIYQRYFNEAGLEVKRLRPNLLTTFPPLSILRATKK